MQSRDCGLVVEDLWFKYRGCNSYVLRGVSLSVKPGVFTCILGPNGAGKTTLLKCMAGILKPYRGCVRVFGVNVHDINAMRRARIISYVPQEFNVAFPYRVVEVVLMGRTPHTNIIWGPSEADEDRALEALEMLGVKNLANRCFTELSGGEKRLVLIARALAQNPRVILMDEPTANLDFRNRIQVLNAARELACEGRVVLATMHDPNLASMYADEIYLFKNGQILASGDPPSVLCSELLEELYEVRVRVSVLDGVRLVVPRDRLVKAE